MELRLSAFRASDDMASLYGRLSPVLQRLFEVMVSDALEKTDTKYFKHCVHYMPGTAGPWMKNWMKEFLSQWAEMPERVLEQRLSTFGASDDQNRSGGTSSVTSLSLYKEYALREDL